MPIWPWKQPLASVSGACVAACPNASAMLFAGAKVSHLAFLPQGAPERRRRVLSMVRAMDAEGFGNCTNIYECVAVGPRKRKGEGKRKREGGGRGRAKKGGGKTNKNKREREGWRVTEGGGQKKEKEGEGSRPAKRHFTPTPSSTPRAQKTQGRASCSRRDRKLSFHENHKPFQYWQVPAQMPASEGE